MKRLTIFITTTILLLTVSCEKEITDTDKQTGEPTPPTVIDEGQKDDALTVAEAIATEPGTFVCVKGYLVASTRQSIKNADFEAPFSGSSAIIIADKSAENYTEFEENEMMPVCLTDCSKSIRNQLNLEDNSENHNHIIYIYALRDTYMSRPGLRKITSYEMK